MDNVEKAIERRIRENAELVTPTLTVGQWRSILFVINNYKPGCDRNKAWHLSAALIARGAILDGIEEAIGHR